MTSYFRTLILCILPVASCFGVQIHFDPDPDQEKTTVELFLPGGAFDDPDHQGVLAELSALSALLQGQDEELFYATGLDLDSAAAIDVRAYDTRILFRLADEVHTLRFIKYLIASFESGTFELRGFELARKALLERLTHFDTHFDPLLISIKTRLLTTLTPAQSQEYAAKWWNLDQAELRISGNFDPAPLKEIFEESHPICKAAQQSSEVSSSTLVIDGKIYMNEPSWYQTRWYGRIFGLMMVATSVGFCVLAILFQPFVGAAAVFSLFTGVYFTAFPYYDDPLVIQEKRKEDLDRGFLHSYKCGRASKTLTPSERRVLFISEALEYGDKYPSKLSGFPISHLADIYDLQDKVIKEMLYPCEIKELQNLKDEFIIARNQFKHERNQLEDELMTLLKPHQILRDIALDNARKKYEADSYIVALRKLQGELGEHTDAIWELWRQGKISSEERDRMINESNAYYKELITDEFLVEQAKRAREILELEQERILRNYKDAEKNCKDLIKYDVRMQNIINGMWGLYARYSDYLVSYIATLEVYDYETFPDYLDLRGG